MLARLAEEWKGCHVISEIIWRNGASINSSIHSNQEHLRHKITVASFVLIQFI